MKKIFAFMAMAAAILAVSCNKPAANNSGNGGGDNTNKYEAPITIDGNFDDWAKLDATKVQEMKCPAGHPKPDLKLAKVYADKYYVFVYLEMDYSAYDGEVTMTHIDFFLDGDANTSTGGYAGQWLQGETPCIDVLIEGSIIEDGEVCDYVPFVGIWGGDVNADGWTWTEVEGLSGFIEGKGDKKVWEFRITRELYPDGKIAKEFNMGIISTVNGWDATGALPNTTPTEENANGQAPLLKVNFNN